MAHFNINSDLFIFQKHANKLLFVK